jgi:hypothetical protein
MPEPKKIHAKRLPHAADLPLPQYQSAQAAGLDLLAAVPADAPVELAPGARAMIPTGFAIALPAVISYVTFLKVERSAYLGIRLDYLYSIYVVFSVAAIVRYAALTWRAIRGEPPDIQIGSGSAL